MNNEIIAVAAAAIEMYEGSNNFVVKTVSRQLKFVNVGSRNPWSTVDSVHCIL